MENHPLRSSMINRRSFVLGSGAFAAGTLLGARAMAAPKKLARGLYPFSLGIACGDPTPTGIVLWTRLAPDPLAPGGGMQPRPVEVSFQIAKDEAMSRVVASGTATAGPQWAHSVHVEVEGLQPDSWYWYQFKYGGEVSPKGRARTLPLPSVMPEKLRFAFASCQNYQFGYYTAFDHLAKESPDLVVHLGDYIYERDTRKDGPLIREHNGGTCTTLDEYRARYALYKSDPMLQRAHEVATWIVTWDDHEFANNCNGMLPEKPKAAAEYVRRRTAAYQAYFEHMPLRRASLPSGPDMLLYRDFNFGKLASFQVLDTRQYRTAQVGGDKFIPQGKAALSPKATILGGTQRKWLLDRLSGSQSSWNVLAQQVMFARVDMTRGEEQGYNMDKWAGYENDRQLLIRYLQQNRIANPVVITGDIHSNWANDIPNDFDGGKPADVAVELVGTSISSSGDGTNKPKANSWLFDENPHVKFHNAERGYVMCEVTPKLWRADFRTVEYITRKGAPLQTRASFVVESGAPKLVKA